MKLKILSVFSFVTLLGQIYAEDFTEIDTRTNNVSQKESENLSNISNVVFTGNPDEDYIVNRNQRFNQLRAVIEDNSKNEKEALSDEFENISLKSNYDNMIKIQRDAIKQSQNAKFRERADRALALGIILTDRALSQEIIEFELSDFRTLFLIFQKSLGSIKNILITNSKNFEINRKNEILKKIIENVEIETSEILKNENLEFANLQEKYNNFLVNLKKISQKLNSLNPDHPLNSICKYMAFFLNFAMINAEANEFLRKNEDKIRAFYNGNMEVSGSVGAYIPVESTGSINVGQKIGISHKTGLADRGVSLSSGAKSETSISVGNKIGSITAKVGLSIEKGKNAVGYNASESIKNQKLSKALEKIGPKIPPEYAKFRQKRTEIMKQAANLNNNLVNFEKFLNKYSGLSSLINKPAENVQSASDNRFKVSYLFIDPKYNLEKEKSIEVSGSGKLEAAKEASLLNMKIKTAFKNTVYRKNNDIYNFIKSSDFTQYNGDFDSFKKVAILCDKYKHIKPAYTQEGACNITILKQSFNKFCKKHGNFNDKNEFINTIEYYASILQELSNKNLSKSSINGIRKVKSKLEKQLGTNGRLETLLLAYFIGVGHIVLNNGDLEKPDIDKLKFALEKTALLLSESRSNRNKNVKDLVCKFSGLSANIKILEDFINLEIIDVIKSPYIYENGTFMEINVDFSKIDSAYGRVIKLNNKLRNLKENSKLPACISTVIDTILSAQDKIANKLESAKEENQKNVYSIIKGMISGLKLLHEVFLENERATQSSLILEKAVPVAERIPSTVEKFATITQKISSAVSKLAVNSAKKKILKFVFKINQKGIEFIGIKTRHTETNQLKIDTDTINKINNTRIAAGEKTKRWIESKFVMTNSKSLFLILKEVSNYCFMKLSDTGKTLQIKEIKEFLDQNFKQSYIRDLTANFISGSVYNLTNILKEIENSVKALNNKEDLKTLGVLKILTSGIEKTAFYKVAKGIKEEELLPKLSLLFFKYIAKPYNEKMYK